MYVLGINAVYHDSAACLVHDGRVIAAAEEERFTRVKHAKRPIPFATYELPFHAIEWVWQWTAHYLSHWAFLEVLEYIGSFSVLIAVIFYFVESGDRGHGHTPGRKFLRLDR